ncbi:MAG: hypothetical protein EZS28_008812 [Streblomastix strix]|uniref:Protein kinase domain-containing protein n=1 Tax=Streblomastix strix TaxID=222440 RepID=A0A5J4WLC0_9EUKA|nr:MAG: hypothetical protein EZS28_008812 [Streblomastix strix]
MAVDIPQQIVHQNPIFIGETVGQAYVVERMLAAGKFSTVFVARAIHDTKQELVALKVIPIEKGYPTLDKDIAILKIIGGRNHFAKIIGNGTHRQHKFIAMHLLGPTLNDIKHLPQIQKMAIYSVAKIGIQGLDALSTLHKAGFIHGKISAQGDFRENIPEQLFREPKD